MLYAGIPRSSTSEELPLQKVLKPRHLVSRPTSYQPAAQGITLLLWSTFAPPRICLSISTIYDLQLKRPQVRTDITTNARSLSTLVSYYQKDQYQPPRWTSDTSVPASPAVRGTRHISTLRLRASIPVVKENSHQPPLGASLLASLAGGLAVLRSHGRSKTHAKHDRSLAARPTQAFPSSVARACVLPRKRPRRVSDSRAHLATEQGTSDQQCASSTSEGRRRAKEPWGSGHTATRDRLPYQCIRHPE